VNERRRGEEEGWGRGGGTRWQLAMSPMYSLRAERRLKSIFPSVEEVESCTMNASKTVLKR
jgi:hypothetical protein